ncbi:MAG: triose-phosphate isomerase [Actinobacteria bacterium]|jgi:triosephosphate isomerase|nr:triose-phosphate isomerase [Actinomycetota bacterium]
MAGAERGRTPLVVGNWKMFKTSGEGASFIRDLAEALSGVKDREIMVAPPFTGLYEAAQVAEGTCISIAAQDVFWEREGAYTGEVSATMLADLGVKAAIIGHSERRQYFGETDEWVAKKVCAALDHGLQPIICVGESEEEREAGATAEVLAEQVPVGLSLVRREDAGRVTLAYEPIWAIGTGKTADPGVAQEAISLVRREVADTLGAEAARMTRILYGGSVGPGNIDELMAQPDIDGVLVGGAGLQVGSFSRIVRFEKP